MNARFCSVRLTAATRLLCRPCAQTAYSTEAGVPGRHCRIRRSIDSSAHIAAGEAARTSNAALLRDIDSGGDAQEPRKIPRPALRRTTARMETTFNMVSGSEVQRRHEERRAVAERGEDPLAQERSAFKDIELARLLHRRWQPGEVYTNKDMNRSEQNRWRKKHQMPGDPFDIVGLDVLDQYKVSHEVLAVVSS